MTNFKDLPLELPNMIYAEALTYPNELNRYDPNRCVIPWHMPATHGGFAKNQPSALALLRVNKSINSEVTPIFYAKNNFRLPHTYPAADDIGTTIVAKGAPFFSHLSLYFDVLDVLQYKEDIRFTLWDFQRNVNAPLENVLQALEERVKLFQSMTNLKYLDISTTSIVWLTFRLRGHAETNVRQLAQRFIPILDKLLRTLPVGVDGSRLCKVRVIYDQEFAGRYTAILHDIWKDLDLSFVDPTIHSERSKLE